MSHSPDSEVYDARNPSLFSGTHMQDILEWLNKFKYFSEANGWDDRKQFIMMPYYLTGSAKQWFEQNKQDLVNKDLLETGLKQTYQQTNLPILEQVASDSIPYTVSKSSARLPVALVHKIKESPPPSSISDAFFKLCLVAACTKREVLMNYKECYFQQNPVLDDYLEKHFSKNGKLNFNSLNLIGNLLLCYVPDTQCEFIPAYREKLRAKDIFEANIEASQLSAIQKSILSNKLESLNKLNCKVCGWIMSVFMKMCQNNEQLPNIDFLTSETDVLTGSEEGVFGYIIE
ncbi:hypothetical protein MFLAVUS_000960 [Mucor flavus]|uniref:Retrotransposon gag domain-containing protein n=1 Tax=Mucor flavus TaxID=439312 RepID=A0ABP9YL56_9FUNG